MKLLLIQARDTARGLGSQRAEGRSAQQKRHFTHEIALLEFLLRKLGLLSVKVENDAQTAFHHYIERRGRALSKEPFSWLEPHIGDGVRQPSAFGFIQTGKDFCRSQLFGSEHVRAPRSLELIATLMYHRMLSGVASTGLSPQR
jgi:hypothetical protein